MKKNFFQKNYKKVLTKVSDGGKIIKLSLRGGHKIKKVNKFSKKVLTKF